MSSQTKFITIGLVIAFGIGNAYYAFNPSLKEIKDKREAETRKTAVTPKSSVPQDKSG